MKAILAILLFCFSLVAQTTVAVYNLEGTDLSPSDLSGLSNRLRAELFKTGKFTVVERSQMDQILTEQGVQLSACTSSECAVEVGQILNVEKVVVGSIEKVGSSLVADVRLVDVRLAKVEQVASSDCRDCSIDDLLRNSMSDLAVQLSGEKVTKSSRLNRSGPRIKGVRIIPGFQVYMNRDLYAAPSDTFVSEHVLWHPESIVDSLKFGDRSDKKSFPFVTLDLGLVTRNDWYVGLYGQLFYAGAMVVFAKEFNPREHLSFRTGILGGVLADMRTEVDHLQIASPDIQVAVGNDRVRCSLNAKLWFAYIEEYNTNAIQIKSINRWIDVERFNPQLSPAVSLRTEFFIPNIRKLREP